MRIIAYCLMPNHWHFLLWPWHDDEVSEFMHGLTGEHASRFRKATGTSGQGAVYQSRFGGIPIEDSWHYVNACLYIERNASVAGLVDRPEQWQWSSASQLILPSVDLPLDEGPIARPNWLVRLNEDLHEEIVF